jgi:predicted Zn-dependent protease
LLIAAIVLLLSIVVLPAFARSSNAHIIKDLTSKEINANLARMEIYYYGHDYNRNMLKERLERLEKTVFKHKLRHKSYKDRYLTLYNHFQKQSSPFYTREDVDRALSDKEITLIRLMETRFFGDEKNQLPLEERISRLEYSVFGTKQEGTLQERFDHLSHNTPIVVKGINITKDGRTIASFRPDIKSPPIPASPHEHVYTPLNIKYNQEAGDYYSNLTKNSSGQILRWKDFPVTVFIHSNNEDEINNSVLAIEAWQKKVPIYQTDNFKTANILIDWSSSGDYITVPIVTSIDGKKEVKVLINMGNLRTLRDKSNLSQYIMHQLGHALGIWGHSDNPADLMYPTGPQGAKDINVKVKENWIYQPITIESKRRGISARDVNTLLRIYQTPTSIDQIITEKNQ